MIAKIIYMLCGLTSASCTFLLFRGYLRSHLRLLLWSACCFFLLTLSNIGVYFDMVILTDVDYSHSRALLTLTGVGVLLAGMILETN